MYENMPVDRARKYFLLVVARRKDVGPHLGRGYLEEKVLMLWTAQDTETIYKRLDLVGQRLFDDLAWADGFKK